MVGRIYAGLGRVGSRQLRSSKRIGRAALLLALVATLAAVAASSAAASPAKSAPGPSLAFIGDLTGSAASVGVPMMNGFKTYIDWTNRTGGVHGQKIKLLVADDASDPTKAHVAFESAVAAHVQGIYGGTNSIAWFPFLPEAQSRGVVLNIIALSDALAFPSQPYLYGMNMLGSSQANLAIGFIKNYLIPNGIVKAKPSIAVFAYVSGTVNALFTNYQADIQHMGWDLVSHQTYPLTATDVTAQAAAIASAKPDVVLANALDSNAPLLEKSLRSQGYNGAILFHTGANAPSTLQAMNDPKVFALRAFESPASTEVPAVAAMVKQAKATKNTQGLSSGSSFFTAGYAYAVGAVQALKKCAKVCTRGLFELQYEHMGIITGAKQLNPSISFTVVKHVPISQGRFYFYANGKEQAAGGWLKGTLQPNP